MSTRLTTRLFSGRKQHPAQTLTSRNMFITFVERWLANVIGYERSHRIPVWALTSPQIRLQNYILTCLIVLLYWHTVLVYLFIHTSDSENVKLYIKTVVTIETRALFSAFWHLFAVLVYLLNRIDIIGQSKDNLSVTKVRAVFTGTLLSVLHECIWLRT